jgi:hypothetical protein
VLDFKRTEYEIAELDFGSRVRRLLPRDNAIRVCGLNDCRSLGAGWIRTVSALPAR